ncbi:MAG: 4-hydroxy-3-methylbut-2-enyl diphosphate reductase [Candidatus Pelagibacter sp.]|jgi:4-hydroxy-3-methylbut-2-enyl diphosphate reductase|nr:4-hydroxy-3-methylbut-2-enyl diphosphate reductase [Candidatus Pelagibacter sp.]|tara:strand:- start:5351 stop:6292 length:942 start_codon:yes stop_codon:yes gene_type:complete
MINKITIHLASPRGFCAGVDRAIEIVKKTIIKYGSPVYVRHEIVHNKQVVKNLKDQGVIFIEELDEIKNKSRPVIFSAHGVPKSVPDSAKIKKIFFIDAICPLVSKVHREAKQLNKNGFKILLIGHANHPEVIGTIGQLSNESIHLIETANDAESYNNQYEKELAYITQTTLSIDDTAEIIKILKKKFPNIRGPIREDICYATTNRQLAVKKIAPLCDIMFVIGSKNSSNSLRLVEVAKRFGCKNTSLIDSKKEYKISDIGKYRNIGISSGASAPEKLVFDLIDEIKKKAQVELKEIEVAKEKVSFKLPKILN